MIGFVLKPALLLTLVFALSAFIIRAQPYEDRVTQALNNQDCPAPCMIGIRPGRTSMRSAVSIIESHAWVARGAGFPALVRNAVFFDAAVPRTRLQWRWSETAPTWINTELRGQLILEDREVRDLTIETSLALGEILLAFGNPDVQQYLATTSAQGRHFAYSAWYPATSTLISVEGSCPITDYYHTPVRVLFRPLAPQLSDAVGRRSVCS